jgi:hypothetical protein
LHDAMPSTSQFKAFESFITVEFINTVHTSASNSCARHRRIMCHRGCQRAVVAVGREILVIAHTFIARGTTYQELGPGYFDRRQADRLIRRCVRTLERLGHKVTIEPLAPTA